MLSTNLLQFLFRCLTRILKHDARPTQLHDPEAQEIVKIRTCEICSR